MMIGAGGALLTAGVAATGWRMSVGSMTAYDAYAESLRIQGRALPIQ